MLLIPVDCEKYNDSEKARPYVCKAGLLYFSISIGHCYSTEILQSSVSMTKLNPTSCTLFGWESIDSQPHKPVNKTLGS